MPMEGWSVGNNLGPPRQISCKAACVARARVCRVCWTRPMLQWGCAANGPHIRRLEHLIENPDSSRGGSPSSHLMDWFWRCCATPGNPSRAILYRHPGAGCSWPTSTARSCGHTSMPFQLAWPGVVSEELSPWREDGESWRRLLVTYPRSIATHSTKQTLYFDEFGLMKRHDYDVEIAGGTPAAHYMSSYGWESGNKFPTAS